MFGKATARDVTDRVEKALKKSKLEYQINKDNAIVLSAMGDDLPIGMLIIADDDNRTLNIYCYLMFDIPADARNALIPELNTLNNSINNGGFFMADKEPIIYFRIVQSYYDKAPSVDLIQHLIMVAFRTVDINDGPLKAMVPKEAVVKGHDMMYL